MNENIWISLWRQNNTMPSLCKTTAQILKKPFQWWL